MRVDMYILDEYCKNNSIPIDEEQLSKLSAYMDIVLEWNEKMNLTSITDRDEFIVKHFCDSLSLLGYLDIPVGASVIDIGTGAGFPAIPLLIARPDLKITMLDSLNKRMIFIKEQVLAPLKLSAEVIHGRAEDFSKMPEYREKYDLAVSRAVANLSALCEYCIPFVKVGGMFASMKSMNYSEETANADNAVTVLGGELSDVYEYTLPDNSGRSILVIDKITNTPNKYPRKGVKIKKNPL